MADMTRAEARGILQQLVKQQQAVSRLADVVAADAELEASIVALRAEFNQLRTAIKQANMEVDTSRASAVDASAIAKKAWDASTASQHELTDVRKSVDDARRQAEIAVKRYAQDAETRRQAQLADADRTVRAHQEHAEAEHAERVLAMRNELEALQARKDDLTREIEGMLSRFSAR